MDLTQIQQWCFDASRDRGWWDDALPPSPTTIAVKLALIHSEISEALEGVRTGSHDVHLPNRLSVEVELADALIRICDLAGALTLDLEAALVDKMLYNAHRTDHNRAVRAAVGGKKF